MRLLREYIRALLTEAAKGPADLPEDTVVHIREMGGETQIMYARPVKQQEDRPAYERSENPRGMIQIFGPELTDDGPCGDAWQIGGSAATRGWGPMLYDVAMEYATQNGGGLISDRQAVSPSARNVWDYYMSNRGDVTGIQLDDKQNTLTPEEEDNCMQSVAMKGVNPKSGGPMNVEWQDSPLSKRYTKPPTTMNALEAAGKLVVL